MPLWKKIDDVAAVIQMEFQSKSKNSLEQVYETDRSHKNPEVFGMAGFY